MRSKGRKVLIGKLGKPHGVKGYLYFHYYGKDISTLSNYNTLFTDGSESFKLEKMFEKSNRLIIKFEESNNRNFAETLRDKDIFILEDDLSPLEEGEYYLFELEGLKVLNLENKTLGVVKGTMGTKSNEVLILEGCDDSIDNTERLIPYIRPQVVKEISLADNYLLVDWPEDF
tara:strand:- start:241 stop:759 length:519 start_codon:yes stop_codon:yes gene_type:complete